MRPTLMRFRIPAAIAAAAAAALALSTTLVATSWADQSETALAAGEPATWTLSEVSAADVETLLGNGFDIVDFEGDTAVVLGDQAIADELAAQGFDIEFHDTVYKDVAPGAAQSDTYYGGYRTAAAHSEHVQAVAAAHPELAEVVTVGESWLKTQGEGGHDILAICLTDLQPGDCEQSPESAKPRISIIAQIHAREIATGEIAWRFIDFLTAEFGGDAAVTELLETTEVWIVPIANPDGVDIVASGGNRPLLQRKNANDTAGSCTGTQKGVDLNRNHSFEWGGASTNPCSEVYQGTSPASEPEVAALEELFTKLHPDQRGPGVDDPAPADTRDVMVSLHSYGGYIIHPWGWTFGTAPNAAELRALGLEQAESNGYEVGTAGETVGYLASGATDDFTYGTLGIASFTYEVGGGSGDCGGFLPAYSCMDASLWPINRDALMTAALAADAPYGS